MFCFHSNRLTKTIDFDHVKTEQISGLPRHDYSGIGAGVVLSLQNLIQYQNKHYCKYSSDLERFQVGLIFYTTL